MSCYVYMLRSLKNPTYYVGISNNVERRLAEHNRGKLKNTSKNKPYEIVFRKEHADYFVARKHEVWLKKKSLGYKNKLANIFLDTQREGREREGPT